MNWFLQWCSSIRWNLTATIIGLSSIVAVAIVGSLNVSDSTVDTFLNLMIVGLSVAVGSIVGTAFTPYDKEEGKKFSVLAKGISIFLSGVIVTKIDSLVTELINKENLVSISQVAAFRLLAAAAVMLSVAKMTFATRLYSTEKTTDK